MHWYLAAAAAALLTMPISAAAQGARLNLDALASLAKGAAERASGGGAPRAGKER
jgi:hypothetical protein